VRFDAEYNEYYFDHRSPTGTTVSIVLYHCPMCGGVASESKRSESLANVSEQEALRIEALIRDLHTVQDIESSLGVPDADETVRPPAEFGLVQPGTGELETGFVRVITYSRLSETADVQFTVYSNGKIEVVVLPKYVGTRKKSANSVSRHRG
jgi:hypothetical protein